MHAPAAAAREHSARVCVRLRAHVDAAVLLREDADEEQRAAELGDELARGLARAAETQQAHQHLR